MAKVGKVRQLDRLALFWAQILERGANVVPALKFGTLVLGTGPAGMHLTGSLERSLGGSRLRERRISIARLRASVINHARTFPRRASKLEASRQAWAYTSTTASSAALRSLRIRTTSPKTRALLASYNCAIADWSPPAALSTSPFQASSLGGGAAGGRSCGMPRRASTRLIAEAIGLFCGDVNVEHSSILVNYERGARLDFSRRKTLPAFAQEKGRRRIAHRPPDEGKLIRQHDGIDNVDHSVGLHHVCNRDP
jgi:hypothetical protein